MTILSAQTIRRLGLVFPFSDQFIDRKGVSGGLGPCTYDFRVDQDFFIRPGEFRLASTIEEFVLPDNVCMMVMDKSTYARMGLAVQNTHGDPGWRGFLTLELTNHGTTMLMFLRGDVIGQAKFEFLDEPTEQPYRGKYQNQNRGPQTARFATDAGRR